MKLQMKYWGLLAALLTMLPVPAAELLPLLGLRLLQMPLTRNPFSW